MDENTRRPLIVIRTELEIIRRAVDRSLEELAKLGAGFAPAPAVDRRSQDGWADGVSRVQEVLPQDLLPKLTVVDQGGGLVTIKTEWLQRPDWLRLDEKVKSVGGVWVADGKRSRWEVNVP